MIWIVNLVCSVLMTGAVGSAVLAVWRLLSGYAQDGCIKVIYYMLKILTALQLLFLAGCCFWRYVRLSGDSNQVLVLNTPFISTVCEALFFIWMLGVGVRIIQVVKQNHR